MHFRCDVLLRSSAGVIELTTVGAEYVRALRSEIMTNC
jgi:hypothetical protein